MHGIEREIDMHINYYTQDDYGCDQRIIDWFTECHEEALDKYDERNRLSMQKESFEYQEKNEREEYERLKKKYE